MLQYHNSLFYCSLRYDNCFVFIIFLEWTALIFTSNRCPITTPSSRSLTSLMYVCHDGGDFEGTKACHRRSVVAELAYQCDQEQYYIDGCAKDKIIIFA